MKFYRSLLRAVSVAVTAALIAIGLHVTPAQAASGDLVISMSVDNLDPAVLQNFVNAQRTCGSLSADIQCVLDKAGQAPSSDISTLDVGITDWPGFSDGTLSITSSGSGSQATDTLTITIPGNDVQANTPGWLITVISASSGILAGWIAGGLCFAAFAPAAPVAMKVCSALATFVTTFVWSIVSARFTNTSTGTGQQLASAFAGALLATVGGVLWGEVLAPWAAANMQNVMKTIANAVSKTVSAAATWLGDTAVSVGTAVAGTLTYVGNAIWNALVTAAEAAGLSSVTSSTALKVLPFGDSITYGYKSSDGAGYRCDLQDYLSTQGDTHQFVGSQSAGPCAQPDNEGHSGWTIGQLTNIEHCTITGYQPNLVLLDIGTNDINNGGDPGTAVSALESLVGKIFTDAPDATVLVSSLIPTTNSTVAANMATFNQQASSWVGQQEGSGKRIHWVDQGAVETTDLSDGLHPNDTGYQKMAVAWTMGIDRSVVKGWIKPAGSGSGSSCGAPVWLPQGQIASGPGSAAADGPGGRALPDGSHIQLADIDGNGKADYLQINGDGSVQAWLNSGVKSSGGVNWTAKGKIAAGVGDPGSNIQFADINGDGKADYVDVPPLNTVPKSDEVKAWINGGADSSAPNGWAWYSGGNIISGDGSNGSLSILGFPVDTRIRFADFGNDGKADFAAILHDSSVHMWRNGGKNADGSQAWYDMGTIASGVGDPGSNIKLADIDGDGRTDYLDVNPDSGAVQAWLDGGQSSSGGWLWYSKGQVASGVGDPGSHIQFADINGDGKADYLDIDPGNGSGKAWLNGGANSSAPGGWAWNPIGALSSGISGQVQFAHLYGSSRADYLYVKPDSSVVAWINSGVSSGKPTWVGPFTVATGAGVPGSEIQFADINGDGRADYLDVKPDSSVHAWFNGGSDGSGGISWVDHGIIASGTGVPGAEVRFADVWNTGRADYLTVDAASGAMDDWYNAGIGSDGKPVWIPHLEIATGTGAPGSEVRLAGLWGTGRADYLIVHPDSSVEAYENGGANSAAQDGWVWLPKGVIATGVGAPGSEIQFADITGEGRADYLDVKPDGSVYAWYNAGS